MLSCLVVVVCGFDALGFVLLLLLRFRAFSFNAVCLCFLVMVGTHCILRRISLSCGASWMVCMVYFGLPSAVAVCSWPLSCSSVALVSCLSSVKMAASSGVDG